MALTLVYPVVADNNYKKYYFVYRLQQKLQIVFNNWGTKYRNEEITLEEWEDFKRLWYRPRMELVTQQIIYLRGLAKNKTWSIDLNNIFIEDDTE